MAKTKTKPKQLKALEFTEDQLKQAENWASRGLRDGEIAALLGLPIKAAGSLKMHEGFSEALMRGRSKGTLAQADAVFTRGINGSTIDSIFWLKSVARWNDKPAPEPIQQSETTVTFVMPRVMKADDWQNMVQQETYAQEKLKLVATPEPEPLAIETSYKVVEKEPEQSG